MVDYMNAHNTKNHVLITFHPNTPYKNLSEGYYNKTHFQDTTLKRMLKQQLTYTNK